MHFQAAMSQSGVIISCVSSRVQASCKQALESQERNGFQTHTTVAKHRPHRGNVSEKSSTAAEQKQYREAGDVRGRKRVQSTNPRRMPATRESFSSIAQRPRV